MLITALKEHISDVYDFISSLFFRLTRRDPRTHFATLATLKCENPLFFGRYGLLDEHREEDTED